MSLGKGRDEVTENQQTTSKARSGGDGVAGDSETRPRRRTCTHLPRPCSQEKGRTSLSEKGKALERFKRVSAMRYPTRSVLMQPCVEWIGGGPMWKWGDQLEEPAVTLAGDQGAWDQGREGGREGEVDRFDMD